MSALDLFGYLGSAVVALSLSMTNIRRLRWINFAGALLFSSYGLLLGAWPVVALNGYIALIDLWHPARMRRPREYFSLLDLPSSPSPFLLQFLAHHRADIDAHFPGFDPGSIRVWNGLWVLRDALPVGLFVHEEGARGEWRVLLDYVVPAYQDLRNARWLFHEGAEELWARGARKLVAEGRSPAHRNYLEKLGFHPCGDPPDRLCLELRQG